MSYSGRTPVFAMVLLAAACEIILATDLRGQAPEAIPTGSRVRIALEHQPGRWMVGRIVGHPGDSLQLRTTAPDSLVVVPAVAVTSLELSRGRRSHALLGSVVGFAAGAAFGIVATATTSSINTDARGYGVVAGLFGALGAGVGALVGWAITTERWEPYGMPTAVAAPRLGLSLTF